MIKLKPCPFCGGVVNIARTSDGESAWFTVTRGAVENACKCRVFMESEILYDEEKEAEELQRLVAAWNRRAE